MAASAKGVGIIVPADFVCSSESGEGSEIKFATATAEVPSGFMGLECGVLSEAGCFAAPFWLDLYGICPLFHFSGFSGFSGFFRVPGQSGMMD